VRVKTVGDAEERRQNLGLRWNVVKSVEIPVIEKGWISKT
jgi:hypothetical protein